MRAFSAGNLAADPAFGLWISCPDVLSIEVVGKAGFAFVILDQQHGGIGPDAVLAAMQVLDLTGTPAFVRTPSNDAASIMRALDLGARGVIVPLVNNPAEAAEAASAVSYPPAGTRSFGPVRTGYTSEGQSTKPLCIVMIETAEALDNLEEICRTPGVDGLFVGPVDLALSLGLSVQEALGFPARIMDSVDRVVEACKRHGLIAGCPAFGMENARALLQHGVDFLPLGSDMSMLRRGATADLELARGWIEGR